MLPGLHRIEGEKQNSVSAPKKSNAESLHQCTLYGFLFALRPLLLVTVSHSLSISNERNPKSGAVDASSLVCDFMLAADECS